MTISLGSILIILSACELILRIKLHYISSSEHLDDGLVLYERLLGWKLAPNWHGQHKHYDFNVNYKINANGFRNNFNIEKDRQKPLFAFVGDSFTFSFGVNDDETFIHLLNSSEPQTNRYVNFGIPGYSTDQESLLIQNRILGFSPDVIFLVVYLANDLFDNELPFPLQAKHAKPYFELISNKLILKNTPVPLKEKPNDQANKDLSSMIFGNNYRVNGFITKQLERFELFRLLKLTLSKPQKASLQFHGRFVYVIDLFNAIIDRTFKACTKKGAKLNLILMPGRSFVENPDSPSAQFQNYFRKSIVTNKKKIKVGVIDLAIMMRELYQKKSGKWFHPNEGHLTVNGQKVVADILYPIINKMNTP